MFRIWRLQLIMFLLQLFTKQIYSTCIMLLWECSSTFIEQITRERLQKDFVQQIFDTRKRFVTEHIHYTDKEIQLRLLPENEVFNIAVEKRHLFILPTLQSLREVLSRLWTPSLLLFLLSCFCINGSILIFLCWVYLSLSFLVWYLNKNHNFKV